MVKSSLLFMHNPRNNRRWNECQPHAYDERNKYATCSLFSVSLLLCEGQLLRGHFESEIIVARCSFEDGFIKILRVHGHYILARQVHEHCYFKLLGLIVCLVEVVRPNSIRKDCLILGIRNIVSSRVIKSLRILFEQRSLR